MNDTVNPSYCYVHRANAPARWYRASWICRICHEVGIVRLLVTTPQRDDTTITAGTDAWRARWASHTAITADQE